MTPVLWIGPFSARSAFEPAFAAAGIGLLVVPDVERAIAAAAHRSIPAAFVVTEVDRIAVELQRLAAAVPGIEIVAVTSGLAEPRVIAALRTGAKDLVALQSASPAAVAERAEAAVGRYMAAVREKDFLRQVRDLTDELLRTTYELERRNLAHEQGIAADEDGSEQYRILVIDDEPTICRMFEMMLDGKGYEIATASAGEEGLELFRQRPFQLVVTDKNLPGINGLEVLQTVKKMRPHTDVVMITGFASKESAVEALNRGAAAYLEKPFDDLAGVEGTLEVLIQRQRLQLRRRRYLETFKQRHRELLRRYKRMRDDLEARLR